MLIKNKKSGWTGEVDPEGWDTICRAGWKDKYDILDRTEPKKSTPLPPEIANFAKPIGIKQTKPDQKKQEPAAGLESTQEPDETKSQQK